MIPLSVIVCVSIIPQILFYFTDIYYNTQGSSGAALSTGLCYTVILVISLWSFIKYTAIKISIKKIFIKPLYSGVLCMVAALLCRNITYNLLSSNIVLFLSVLSGAVVYFIAVWLMGEIDWICKKHS